MPILYTETMFVNKSHGHSSVTRWIEADKKDKNSKEQFVVARSVVVISKEFQSLIWWDLGLATNILKRAVNGYI